MRFFGNKNAVNGRMVKLRNKNKKAVESDYYYPMYVEDHNGDNERCLLFSQSDVNKIQDVEVCDFYEDMKTGRLYMIGNKKSYFIKIIDLENNEKVVRLNKTIVTNGTVRAQKNPEDIPDKGFIQDLLD